MKLPNTIEEVLQLDREVEDANQKIDFYTSEIERLQQKTKYQSTFIKILIFAVILSTTINIII